MSRLSNRWVRPSDDWKYASYAVRFALVTVSVKLHIWVLGNVRNPGPFLSYDRGTL